MPTDTEAPSPERQQTDESLRLEREKADAALGEHLAGFDEVADAVINRARVRADGVLAAARAKTDRRAATQPAGDLAPAIVAKERQREDQVLREERANADEVLREERAEHVALLAVEREETDKDLVLERDRSDEAIATRDEFLGIVSHDLRNLLSAVMGYSALIETEVSEKTYGAAVVANARRIQRSGARMNRLIGDLIDVASIQAGVLAVTREVEDPTHVVTEAVDTFQSIASAREMSVVAEIVQPLKPATFDAARILQVLTNFLSNAIKFTPRHGKVVVRVETVGDELLFSVTDTGQGIAADKLEAVFERYLQVAPNDRRGVGLGLYISKCIVQGHGGRIWAESKIGHGSTFSFTIPTQVS